MGQKIKNFTPTHIRGEEVQQSISSSRQSEGTDQENSQHQVREGRCHIHSLKIYRNIKITCFLGGNDRCNDLGEQFCKIETTYRDSTGLGVQCSATYH